MSATALISSKGTNAIIQRRASTRDSGGGLVTTWNQIGPVVKAFVQDKSGSEAIRYGRENARRFAVVYVAPLTDIAEKDRLIVGTRTFDVQASRTRGDGGLGHMILEAEETLP